MAESSNIYRLTQKTKVFSGKVFGIETHELEYPGGLVQQREIVTTSGGAVIVPMLANGDLIFISQYRAPIQDFIVEFPAGKLEPRETPLQCARRELQEETGYDAATFQDLASIYTTPGFCDEILHIFLARGLKKLAEGQSLEPGESGLTVHILPMHEALQRARDNLISDAKTLCGLFYTEMLLRTEKTTSQDTQ